MTHSHSYSKLHKEQLDIEMEKRCWIHLETPTKIVNYGKIDVIGRSSGAYQTTTLLASKDPKELIK